MLSRQLILSLFALLLGNAATALAQLAPHDLQNIAEKPIAAFWSRPSEHLKNPVLATLYNEIQGDIVPRSRDSHVLKILPKIDSIKLSFGLGRTVWSPTPMPQPVILYHTTDAATATTLFNGMTQGMEAKTTPEWKAPIYTHKGYGPPGNEAKDPNAWRLQNGFTQLDPQTIVQTDNIEVMLKTLTTKATPAASPAWSADLTHMAQGQSIWLIDLVQFRDMLKDEKGPPGGMESMIFNSVKTLWEQADYAFINIDTTNGIQLSAMAQSANAEAAQRFKGTIEGLLGIAKGFMPMAKQGTEQLNKMTPGMGTMLYTELENVVNGIKITQAGTQTKLTLSISQEFLGKVPALLLPAIKSARAAAMANVSRNNLKQIVLALLNYNDANRAFPAAVMLGPDGKTPHSWRVAILPYIEEQALYNQYKFDEPWDSENNKKVAATMPQVYRSATATNGQNCTSYVTLTHPDGVFSSTPAAKGTRIAQIVDGMSKTLAVVEANAEIPWTKPEDLPVVDGQPLPKLGMPGATIFNVAFCDGSVHSLSIAIKDELLRNLVNRKDGKVINYEDLEAPSNVPSSAVPGSVPSAPKAMPAPPPGFAPETKAPAPPAPPLPAPAPPAPPAVPAPPRVNP